MTDPPTAGPLCSALSGRSAPEHALRCFLDLAALEEKSLIGNRLGEGVVVGHDDDDGSAVGLGADDLPEDGDAVLVEPGGRLVQEEEHRLVDKSARERHALPLAT